MYPQFSYLSGGRSRPSFRFIGSTLVFALCLLISGCAQTVKSVIPGNKLTYHNTSQDISLKEGHGYMLMAVNTNQTIKRLFIDGEVDIILTHRDLKKGTNYIMVPLPKGKYAISKIELPYSLKFTFNEDDYWDFTVEPGTISYIGDLKAEFYGWYNSRVYYELENRSSFALMFLEAQFPQVLTHNKMIYGGFGEDKFLEEMSLRRTHNFPKEVTTTGEGEGE